MKKAIYLSIKPKYTKLIESGEKNYEFRNYYPKEKIDTLFVYESSPTCALKYIVELGDIIKYPDKILEQGYGNDEFNNGFKKSLYAYQIKRVYILEKPISLKTLREKYSFTPPQSYAYYSRYEELTNFLKQIKIR